MISEEVVLLLPGPQISLNITLQYLLSLGGTDPLILIEVNQIESAFIIG
jgi:hypothetical protein